MRNARSIEGSLDYIRLADGGPNKYAPLSIDGLRAVWADGKQRGRIVILEGAQKGDAADVTVGMIVTTDDGYLVRVALSKSEAINLSRTLVESA